jgi:cytochrome c556
MLRIAATVAAIAVGATVVYAQSAAIGQRQQILKTFGGALKEPGAMMKGEKPFDLAVVQASLKVLSENAPKLKPLFPDDSKTGGDTAALPAIWEKNADFMGRFDKLAADATAAATAIKDEASFKAEWPKIGANCGGCHKEYKKAQ